jgi:excisionase family DNA binding protein
MPPITQDGDSVTIRGAALPLLYRAVLALAARHNRDGIIPPPLLHDIRTLLYRAVMSPTRHKDASDVVRGACCEHQQSRDDWCTTGEAAFLLGISRRSVQRMVKDPGGPEAIRVGRTYLLRLAPLLVQNERKAT